MKRIMVAGVLIMAILFLWIYMDQEEEEPVREQDIVIWYPSGFELLEGKNLNQVEILENLEKEKEISLYFETVSGDLDKQAQIMMAEFEDYDAAFYKFTPKDLLSGYERGEILDYSSYLKDMPNLSRLFEEEPLLYQYASVDGKLLFFPGIKYHHYEERMLAVRTDFKAQTGAKNLESPEDLLSMLEQQKVLYELENLKGAGKYFVGLSGYQGDIKAFQPVFGTGEGEYWNKDKTELLYGPVSEEYRKYLIFLQELYEKGLLDAKVFEEDGTEFEKYFLNNQSGTLIAPVEQEQKLVLFGEKNGDNIEVEMIHPMSLSSNEPAIYESSMRTTQILDFGFALNTKMGEEKRREMLSLIDYLYSEEGLERMNFGTENVHHVKQKGKNIYNPKLLKEEYYMFAMSNYIKQDFLCIDRNANFWMLPEDTQNMILEHSYESDFSFSEPKGYYTKEEQEEIAELSTILKSYVQETAMNFIFHSPDPSDERQWEGYQNAVKQYGLLDYLKIKEKAFHRMETRVFKQE